MPKVPARDFCSVLEMTSKPLLLVHTLRQMAFTQMHGIRSSTDSTSFDSITFQQDELGSCSHTISNPGYKLCDENGREWLRRCLKKLTNKFMRLYSQDAKKMIMKKCHCQAMQQASIDFSTLFCFA